MNVSRELLKVAKDLVSGEKTGALKPGWRQSEIWGKWSKELSVLKRRVEDFEKRLLEFEDDAEYEVANSENWAYVDMANDMAKEMEVLLKKMTKAGFPR